MIFVWETNVQLDANHGKYTVRIYLGDTAVYTRTYDATTGWTREELARRTETELGEHLRDLVQAKINKEQSTPYE